MEDVEDLRTQILAKIENPQGFFDSAEGQVKRQEWADADKFFDRIRSEYGR